jgi:hypothetical protein
VSFGTPASETSGIRRGTVPRFAPGQAGGDDRRDGAEREGGPRSGEGDDGRGDGSAGCWNVELTADPGR